MCQGVKLILEESLAPQSDLKMKEAGPSADSLDLGPLALSFDDKKGWIVETLGPTSRHWKRLARENNKQATQANESRTKGKREAQHHFKSLT